MFIQHDDPDTVQMWVDLCKCLRFGLSEWGGCDGECHTLTIASEDGTAQFLGFSFWELKDLRDHLHRYVTGIEKERNTTDLFERAAKAYQRHCVQAGRIRPGVIYEGLT